MGQAAERSRQQLQNIGYFALPAEYVLNEEGIFMAKQLPALKGFSVLLNPQEIGPYMSHLQFRRQHHSLFVQICYAEVKKHQQNYCKLTVYVEHLSLRLGQVASLPFQAMIRILYQTLKGFQVLFQQYGYFTVDASLIGVTAAGEAKCWSNRKFSHSLPKSSYSYSKNAKGENSMVSQLKEIFQCHVDRFTVPRDFALVENTFDGLLAQMQGKFGKEELQAKISLDAPRPFTSTEVGKQEIVNRTSTTAGVNVRFNYQMKQQTQSAVRVTFNQQPPPRTASSSVGKPKISFNYQPEKSLQATKANSLIRQ